MNISGIYREKNDGSRVSGCPGPEVSQLKKFKSPGNHIQNPLRKVKMFSVRLGSRYAAPAAAKLCLLFLSYLPRSKLRYVDLSFSGDRYNFDLKQFDIFSIILLMDVYTPLSSIAGRAKERCIRSLRCCNAFSNGGVNWDRCRASPPIDHSFIHSSSCSFL